MNIQRGPFVRYRVLICLNSDLPALLLNGIAKLQRQFPDDKFEANPGNLFQRIFCHDCPLQQFGFKATMPSK